MTAYRTDSPALRERVEGLRRELALAQEEAARLETARARARALEEELRDAETELGRRRLPRLQELQILVPCEVAWDSMTGSETSRFCGDCQKQVYNLSAMSEREAQGFLESVAMQGACVRFYRRPDGTVMTAECDVAGAARRRRLRIGAAALALTSLGAGLTASLLPSPPVLVEHGARWANDTARTELPPAPLGDPSTKAAQPDGAGRRGGWTMGAYRVPPRRGGLPRWVP
ncbi:MAG: hypothetical protein HOO96_13050 [Polyangiaceae bacterium]|nr:hypothetical protein [Polyangiaceae bacterium]